MKPHLISNVQSTALFTKHRVFDMTIN